MEPIQIGGILQSTTLSKPSSKQSENRWQLSDRQRTEAEKFKASFPLTNDVLVRFAPANWSKCINNQDKCFTLPCVSLKALDRVYEHDGLAKQVVKNNMIGIYSASTASYSYKDEMMNIVSDLFVAKYGGECNLYGMMLYFANYLVEYKSTYQTFDMQDILQQFGRKFLPWWRSKLENNTANGKDIDSDSSTLKGRIAMIAMLGQRLIQGDKIADIKNSNLMKFGYASESDLPDIIKYAEEHF